MRRRRERTRPVAINVTSLVDVAFTLLIVFIIIAPAMQAGIPVDLPDTSAPALEATDPPLTLTIRSDGRIHLDSDTVAIGDLAEALSPVATTTALHVRADAGTAYDHVARVLGRATDLGYHRISLVTDPES